MKTIFLTLFLLLVSGVADASTLSRESLGGGLAHYQLAVRVGPEPHAVLRLHRVVREHRPWRPVAGRDAIVLLHGDFSGFESNFLPAGGGLAGFLAGRGVDVWGVDRRWHSAEAGDDLADLAGMGFAQASADTELALGLVRLLRGDPGRVVLGGFSRGGLLAYVVAAEDAMRKPWRRQVSALLPIDVYATIAPEDEELRLAACAREAEARAAIAAGTVESDNQFFIDLGNFALGAPAEPSPIFPGLDNLGAMLAFLGETYFFFAPAPFYHLAAPGESDADELGGWLAAAPRYQAMAEIADGEAAWCEGVDLAVISVPIFYLGAGGGFGELGLYGPTLTASDDVETLIVSHTDERALDVGHADLLFAASAATEAWTPLAAWILGVR